MIENNYRAMTITSHIFNLICGSRNMLVVTLIVSAVTYTLAYSPEALKDQITDLPGAENLNIPFNQFSGYLTVGGTKNMHYWLVESEGNPTSDPINFWTNGGPGCSGLIGFMTEQGPLRPNKDLTLSINDFAWNKVSNMVFIESPCGVGYSYSDNPDDYVTGDAQTAQDNYELIQAFMDRFPEYRQNDLYISSESYGGHYMPTLAKQIVDENSAGQRPTLNFKGFAVGNPYTDVNSGTPAMMATFWGHQLVAKPTWDEFSAKCTGGVVPHPIECLELTAELNEQIGDLNPYALDYPVCETGTLARIGRAQRTWFMNHQLSSLYGKDSRLHTLNILKNSDYEPCEDNYAVRYLNQDSVKAALHVNSDVKWMECSYSIRYEHNSNSTAPIYNYLIDGGYGLNILVYSGDDDSICATVGTQDWIWGLGYEIAGKKWQTYTVAGQTAGYATKWTDTKLCFLTVHGAGHEVPTYKPEVALDMYEQYLAGKWTDA